jgi:hypothetical protein
MLRRTIPLLVALLLLLAQLAAAPVPAAPKPDDSVSASATKLLQHRKIQKELKLSAEQRIVILDGLADIDEEYEKKLIELSRMPNPNEECYDKLDKEQQKQRDKLLTDTATKTLTAAQRTRLQQLDFWLRGPNAFTDPKVEKKLVLTDAQKKKATEVAERMNGQLERFINGDCDEEETKRRADLFKFRKDRLKEMEDALTADQKTAWTAMLGAAPTGFVIEDLWLKIEEELDLQVPLP